MFVFGFPNCTRLNTLNASARNCSWYFSAIRVFLNKETSKLSVPGPRRFGINRGAFPKVNGALKEKADVLKYCNRRLVTAPSKEGFWPFQFGRWVPARLPLEFPPVICSGGPL